MLGMPPNSTIIDATVLDPRQSFLGSQARLIIDDMVKPNGIRPGKLMADQVVKGA